MKISSKNTQTRRLDSFKGASGTRNLMEDLESKLENIKTHTMRNMKFGDSWAKREVSTDYEISEFLTREQELTLRMENMMRETVSVYLALHAFDGALTADTYNGILKEVEATMKNIEGAMNVKGYVLTLYTDGKLVGTKMFDDEVRMKMWFSKHLEVDYTTFLSSVTIPVKHGGSVLVEQDWCSNPNEFFSKIRSQS